ncbi:MAG: PGPGW domain-containing protein [Nanoarchaeota archaeon]|nr:PGPGW domain-containing protein [Nanoarchaeota archaeon]
MKSSHYIEYEQLLKQNRKIVKLQKLNVVLIPKKHFKVVGSFLIILGILTIPIPGITFPLIILGFYFLGLSKYHFLEEIERKWRISKLRKLMK